MTTRNKTKLETATDWTIPSFARLIGRSVENGQTSCLLWVIDNRVYMANEQRKMLGTGPLSQSLPDFLDWLDEFAATVGVKFVRYELLADFSRGDIPVWNRD